MMRLVITVEICKMSCFWECTLRTDPKELVDGKITMDASEKELAEFFKHYLLNLRKDYVSLDEKFHELIAENERINKRDDATYEAAQNIARTRSAAGAAEKAAQTDLNNLRQELLDAHESIIVNEGLYRSSASEFRKALRAFEDAIIDAQQVELIIPRKKSRIPMFCSKCRTGNGAGVSLDLYKDDDGLFVHCPICDEYTRID